MAAATLSWERFRHPIVPSRADYRLLLDGEPTGLWIKWCGHPTALRPYYLASERRSMELRTFRTVAEAKAAAETMVAASAEAA